MLLVRTLLITMIILLATIPMARAEDADAALPNLGAEHQSLHSIDTNISRQEYDKICKQNKRVVLKNLRSYSKSKLESLGISRQSAGVMSATLGVLANDARLDLNESKTLSLEVKDVSNSDPTVVFGFNVDW